MDEELLLGCNRQELDFLLNFSRISDEPRESSFADFSMSRDKLNISEKERTREESYEDIMKQIHQTKLERIELAKQLQSLKNEVCKSYLQPFKQEFKELNEQNLKLRQELTKPAMKYNEDRCERYSNRSSIKMKTSIKSSYGDENKKTNAKPRRNHVSPNNLLKKDAKLAESTANLGRSQIQSPKNHKKRQSQLTERKAEESNSVGVSVNISVLDDKLDYYNIRQSVSKDQLRVDNCSQRNIFLNFLQNILNEEKQYESQKFGGLHEISSTKPESNQNREIVLVNQLQGQIKEANQKLEMLSLIVTKYQKQISMLNINLKNVQEWTDKLWEVKGKYVQMEKRCIELGALKKQFSQKQKRLNNLKESHILADEQKSIASVETMIKLLANPSLSFDEPSKLYMRYYKQIRELFKFDKEDQSKRFNKIIKVRQAIDSIREGRKKFNELIHIYESRILKLQEKINKVRTYNQKR